MDDVKMSSVIKKKKKKKKKEKKLGRKIIETKNFINEFTF